jgi:hypothetical protein
MLLQLIFLRMLSVTQQYKCLARHSRKWKMYLESALLRLNTSFLKLQSSKIRKAFLKKISVVLKSL